MTAGRSRRLGRNRPPPTAPTDSFLYIPTAGSSFQKLKLIQDLQNEHQQTAQYRNELREAQEQVDSQIQAAQQTTDARLESIAQLTRELPDHHIDEATAQ